MHPLTHTTLVGNWATLLLATNKNGEIDYKRMGDEIDILIASSPCGIYSNGTAGEFYTQNEEEFIKTSELLAEKCSAASIPFQIGVSHMSPQISLNRLQAVKSLNPGAVQVSVFIPGHNLASGILSGAHGAYSNIACLNPFAAQKWYEQITANKDMALELEERIHLFMDKLITPFIVKEHFPNHACDRFMALVGKWADIGSHLRWPYRSIPEEYVFKVREEGYRIIPEFFNQ